LARHGNADAGRGTTPAELIELQADACSVAGLWVVAATSCMGCLGCVSIDGMELDQKPTQSPGPAWWRPPRAIVWLGALLLLSVEQSVDALPDWTLG
jgi:hypothetical protein